MAKEHRFNNQNNRNSLRLDGDTIKASVVATGFTGREGKPADTYGEEEKLNKHSSKLVER